MNDGTGSFVEYHFDCWNLGTGSFIDHRLVSL